MFSLVVWFIAPSCATNKLEFEENNRDLAQYAIDVVSFKP